MTRESPNEPWFFPHFPPGFLTAHARPPRQATYLVSAYGLLWARARTLAHRRDKVGPGLTQGHKPLITLQNRTKLWSGAPFSSGFIVLF